MKSHSVKTSLIFWSWLSLIASYMLLLGGAIVTKTKSGEGCGNTWPFCQGVLIPDTWSNETIWEYAHRIVAGITSICVIIFIILAWKNFKKTPWVRFLSIASIFFIFLQGALGAFTVVLRDSLAKNIFLAFHFGLSLVAFASVALIFLLVFRLSRGSSSYITIDDRKSPYLKKIIVVLLLFIYIVVYTGALVRHSNAALACGTFFPSCQDGFWLPDLTTPMGIHRLHRWLALLFWSSLCGLCLWLKKIKADHLLQRRFNFALMLFTIQALLGILIVKLDGALLIALLHTTFVAIGFTFIADLYFFCRYTSVINSLKLYEKQDKIRRA